MSDWKEWFNRAKQFPPRIQILDHDGNITSTYYEDLYQAFKARMEAENATRENPVPKPDREECQHEWVIAQKGYEETKICRKCFREVPQANSAQKQV